MALCASKFAPSVQNTLRGASCLDALAFREFGKLIHTVANFFARQAQLIKFLQIEPKFWAGAKPVAESPIGCDCALTVNEIGAMVGKAATMEVGTAS